MFNRNLKYSTLTASLLMTLVMAGCGASNKEGTAGGVAKVNEADCIGCHSGQYQAEKLTGENIVQKYTASKHNLNMIGCQDCHGGGAQHNGVGPMPFPRPTEEQCKTCHAAEVEDFLTSNHGPTDFTKEHAEDENHRICSRCHTHEGAVLGGIYGYTGDKALLQANADKAPGLDLDGSKSSGMKCTTCHSTHKTDELRTPKTVAGSAVVDFQPSAVIGATVPSTNKQFNLCTSCHNYSTPDGKIVGSGSAGTAKFYHDTAWYRVIASTHYDNPATPVVEGYVLRTNGKNPCFDCHGHEMKTGTRYGNTTTPKTTIYTEWAESGHAGKLLAQKYAKATELNNARSAATVDAVMAAGATEATGPAWVHYDFTQANRATCQKCHTATGAENFLKGPATYVAANNNFSHRTAGQKEVLYCWGCHSDANKGTLNNPGAVNADYSFSGATAKFPDVGPSNVCVACHSGQAGGANIVALADASMTNVAFVNSHYMAAAGLMYNKIGFIDFVDRATVIGTSTYGKSLTSVDDGGAISSTHRKLGTAAMATDSHEGGRGMVTGGPCVACHMSSKHHTLEMDATAFNEVCVKCHDSEGTTTLTAANFKTVFIEEQGAVFEEALDLALAKLSERYNISYNVAAYPYFYDNSLSPVGAVRDWTRGGALSAADAKRLMGACFNINVLKRDPAAFAHARTYSRRLLYDTIDFLDDGVINLSTGATAQAWNPTLYVKGASATDPATTEAFRYLAGYSRSTGAWNAVERP